jgi:acetyl-CoA C-acetyltransferase
MSEVVIAQAVRSAVGKKNGTLSATHPIDILGPVQKAALERAGVEASAVGQVVGGCIDQVGAQAANISRTAWLAYGGPVEVPASTVDSQCGSSQHAVNLGYSLIASGVEDVVLACGVENMSMVPIGANAVDGVKAGHGKPVNRSYWRYHEFTSQFEGAERIAEKYGISRADTDAFGLRSQELAARAWAEDRFGAQIEPIEAVVPDEDGKPTDERVRFARDEILRETSLEALAGLKPVARENGGHTAGSSSQIADGAAAVLLMSRARAEELGVTPLATITQTNLVGCDPVLMLEGPIPSTRKLLADEGIGIDDVDLVEINEAFASVALAWAKTVGANMARVNPNGGAIALGHPLGATGCFLTTKAVHELQRSQGGYALVTMCCGGGLGTGTLIKRED